MAHRPCQTDAPSLGKGPVYVSAACRIENDGDVYEIGNILCFFVSTIFWQVLDRSFDVCYNGIASAGCGGNDRKGAA